MKQGVWTNDMPNGFIVLDMFSYKDYVEDGYHNDMDGQDESKLLSNFYGIVFESMKELVAYVQKIMPELRDIFVDEGTGDLCGYIDRESKGGKILPYEKVQAVYNGKAGRFFEEEYHFNIARVASAARAVENYKYN